MKTKRRQPGFTLMEEAIVVAVISLLVVLGIPAVRVLIHSFETEGGTKSMISAALASARAIAAKEQRYAGIRFQHTYYKDDPANSPLKAPQYMIFIVYDFDNTKLADGFRAVEGLQPIKLPDSAGVMEVVNSNGEIDDTPNGELLIDKTTFSIIFSPSGKLIIHPVQTRNRNGESSGTASKDDIFNTWDSITDSTAPHGMFLQDYGTTSSDYPRKESSRNSFIIYDRTIFEKLNPNSRYGDYLKDLQVIYINPYTGTMINR
ncbi:MAG: hypothetical protein WAK60_01600 [Sedimentisphaerales bacterium]